jgi:hypothetical protein
LYEYENGGVGIVVKSLYSIYSSLYGMCDAVDRANNIKPEMLRILYCCGRGVECVKIIIIRSTNC